MIDSTIVPYLFLATFIVAIIFGFIQYRKARKAKQEHHHSVTEKKDMRADGKPGVQQR